MEQKSKDDVISSFELQLKALAQKLAELERRLAVLERSLPTSKLGTPKLIPSKPMPSLRGRSYIERAIDAARRDYEREHSK